MSLPGLSIHKKVRAKEGGKENGQDAASPLIFLLPMVHCASSPVLRVTRVSRWPLCEKRIASGGDNGWLTQ